MQNAIDRWIDWWLKQNFWHYLWMPVALSVVVSELVVVVLNLLWLGYVDRGYLLTGLVTATLVSLAACAALFFFWNRVDRRLQREYAFSQKIVESVPGAFYLFDDTGRFLAWNDNLETVLGRTADEIARSHPLDFFDEHDHARVQRAINEVFEGGRSSVEATLCAKDGKCTPYYFNGFRFEIDGRPALLGIGIDITERKQAEAELLDAKDRLALALEATSASIWDFDIKAGVVYLDGQWANLTGAAPGVTAATAAELLRVTHPEDRDRVVESVRSALKGAIPHFQEEFRIGTESGGWTWIRCSGKVAERDAEGRALRAIGTNLDITERKVAGARIHQLAYYDGLTGLPNRTLLLDRLSQAFSQAKRFERSLAVMFLDLDDFKRVNDTFGHQAGDELLCEVARRLVGCVRIGDTVSRQGGDEFVIVLAEIAQPRDAARVADKILRAMEASVHVADRDLDITASIGISIYPVNGADDIHQLMKKADIAMYAAKKAGRNRYEFFEAKRRRG